MNEQEFVKQFNKDNKHINEIVRFFRFAERHGYDITTNKSQEVDETLGCTIQEFKEHIESKFTFGMCWANYGFHGWHLDHIRPCASFSAGKLNEKRYTTNK